MAWSYLFIAGLLEIAWAIGLKYSEGFSRLWPSVWTIVTSIASILFLAQALKTIPLGTGYVVWTGIGAVGTALLGMLLFDESREPFRLACIIVIVTGIIGLRVTSS